MRNKALSGTVRWRNIRYLKWKPGVGMSWSKWGKSTPASLIPRTIDIKLRERTSKMKNRSLWQTRIVPLRKPRKNWLNLTKLTLKIESSSIRKTWTIRGLCLRISSQIWKSSSKNASRSTSSRSRSPSLPATSNSFSKKSVQQMSLS